jgi:MFS family permease
MRFLVPQIFYTGVSIAFYTGLFVPFIFKTVPEHFTEQEQFAKSMNVMSLLGLGALLGCIMIGWIYDNFGHKAACVQNVI